MLSTCSDLHQTALYPSISSPRPTLHFVYVWMHLKCERLLQQWGKRKGDQPAHVERHGCSLMWLQLGSPGPNEVLWSSAAPSPIAYTPAAHILPLLHHSGSLRRCSQIPQGTLEMKKRTKKGGEWENDSPQDWHTGVWVRTAAPSASSHTLQPTHSHKARASLTTSSICLSKRTGSPPRHLV